MNVAALRLVLEHVPDDVVLAVSASRDVGYHVVAVERQPTRRPTWSTLDVWPARLWLRGGEPLWYGPEPPFDVRGRFRRHGDLMAELDRADLPS